MSYLLRVRNREGSERTDNSADVHISNPTSTVLTLCGWVDVDNEIVHTGKATCAGCIAVVKHVEKYLAGKNRKSPLPSNRAEP